MVEVEGPVGVMLESGERDPGWWRESVGVLAFLVCLPFVLVAEWILAWWESR